MQLLLRLHQIALTHFKNYRQTEFEFSGRIIGISGPNGIGKTNLLDAIHYLCFSRSYFTRTESRNVLQGMEGFRIHGNFSLNQEQVGVTCILREGGKKEMLWNSEKYEKFSLHIGRLPCVVIAPDDVYIIASASEERRRFLDTLIAQLNPGYLRELIDYNKILQQRNSYLRNLTGMNADQRLLDVYDSQLSEHGRSIFTFRRDFLQDFIPEVQRNYSRIAGKSEPVELLYRSQAQEGDLFRQLGACRQKDILTRRTTTGVHKDDLEILLDGQPFKGHASQGQRKSLLFALKLSEFGFLKKFNGFSPLLLLDDIFEKLDESRMHNLLQTVCFEHDGQIFITDTHAGRIEQHIHPLGMELQSLALPHTTSSSSFNV